MYQHVLLCRCVHRTLFPPEAIDRVCRGLADAGVRLTLVDDLCGWAADRDSRLAEVMEARPTAIVACYPRAVQWLLEWAGAGTPEAPVPVHNLRTQPAEEILKTLTGEAPRGTPTAPVRETADFPETSADRNGHAFRSESANTTTPVPWVPWFPVLDYERCVHCRQCVSFCPFGVYAVDDGKVVVTAPRNCKDNCPACARMCPKQAIIFPKVPDSPINGDVVTEAALHEARQRLDEQKKAIAEEDLHSILAKRKLKARLRQT